MIDGFNSVEDLRAPFIQSGDDEQDGEEDEAKIDESGPVTNIKMP